VLRLQHPQKALEPRILFGALADGRMVGYIAGHFSTRHGCEGELQSIYVLPKYQRRRIGGELLKRLAGWFAARGQRSICVGVEPTNPYRRFYEKHGARYLDEHWLVWDDISAVADES
jgi:GNAT superfamily N-acetyltransferase